MFPTGLRGDNLTFRLSPQPLPTGMSFIEIAWADDQLQSFSP